MNSEQLILLLRMPWDGRDPRSLTRAAVKFSLASEGTGRSNLEPIRPLHVDQIEMFPEGTPYGS